MALFVKQNEERTKLQERLAAELLERQKRQHEIDNPPQTPDDTSYLKDTQDSSPYMILWIIGIVLALILLGVYIAVNAG